MNWKKMRDSWVRHEWSPIDDFTTEELEGQNLLFTDTALKWIVFLSNLPKRFVVWENLSSHYSEISFTHSLSPAAPSISDSLLLNWHKYLPFTMCQLFLQCQRICKAQNERLLLLSLHFKSLHYAALQAYSQGPEERCIVSVLAQAYVPFPSLAVSTLLDQIKKVEQSEDI